MTDDLEARLRAAIHAEADNVDAELPPERPVAAVAPVGAGAGAAGEDESLTAIRSKVRTIRRRRRAVALAAATALVVVGLAALPRLGGDPTDVDTVGQTDRDLTPVPPDVSTTASPGTTSAPDTTAADAGPPAGGPGTTTTTAPPDPYTVGDGYQPLWPFASREAATAWQADYRADGSQPWHLDAEDTALSFTTGFLGFTGIDQVVDRQITAGEAYVSVGYAKPDGSGNAVAAEVHLLRYGTGDEAPWEVVGTRDTTLQLETPDYATTARSPMTVGGYITGVDESLRVRVLQSSSAAPLGESSPFPAGGDHAPWQTTVTFSGATDPALTVVVSTGGQTQDVERFAITGLARLGR